jgi:hypothetical protein
MYLPCISPHLKKPKAYRIEYYSYSKTLKMTLKFTFLPKDKDQAVKAIETALQQFPESFEDSRTIIGEHLNYICFAWSDTWRAQVDDLQKALLWNPYIFSSTICYIGRD